MCAVYILIQKVVTILHSVLQVCIFNVSLYIEEFHLLMMFIFDPFVESWQFSLLCQNVDYHLKSKMWIIFLRPNVENQQLHFRTANIFMSHLQHVTLF
jgi:hypothetical protein